MSSFCLALFYNSHYFLRSRGSMRRRSGDVVWSRGWCGIVFVGVEVTVQSKERISIKGCCASLRDSGSHIPRCRVSALYSRPPISPSPPSPTAPRCQSFSARRFNLFSLPLLFFHGHFQRSDWFHKAKNLHGLFGTLYRRFSALVVRVIITVHWRFKKRDKTRNVWIISTNIRSSYIYTG